MRGEDDGVFATVLKCANYECSQGVSILGDYSSRLIDSSYATEVDYTVRDFHPALLLINVPVSAPEPIKDALQRSFALYWRDPQSCAGAIRTAIEGIAEKLGQPAQLGGRFISLGNRLKKLKATHPDLVEAAEAIKGIGNAGAHGGAVDRPKLLTAFELLELELRRLFSDDATRRQELIQQLRT